LPQLLARKAAEGKMIDGKPVLEQRTIDEEDVCPICQDELLAKRLPVTYCKSVLLQGTHSHMD
jgi:hypothetical protein